MTKDKTYQCALAPKHDSITVESRRGKRGAWLLVASKSVVGMDDHEILVALSRKDARDLGRRILKMTEFKRVRR